MKKGIYKIYIGIFFCLCLVPGIAMAFEQPEVVANEVAVEAPALMKDGTINTDFPEEATSYVDKNFGFRQEMITANGLLRKALGESGNEKVILGRDGWLFFEETVKDYTGRATMNDRELFCAAKNLETLKKSVEEKGSRFFFTVAPNKNSLYGEYMPKHYLEHHRSGNYAALEPYLLDTEYYINLFEFFAKEEKPMYFKEDSHWNNEGALLARNEILQAMERDMRSYTSAERHREESHHGDLYEMAYPKSSKREEDVHYQIENRFSYLYKVRDNDEPLIETVCEQGQGKLIFFRDSFGTALLPYFADEYEEAWFSKETPYNFTYAGNYFPGDVIVELVERNLKQLCQMAPVIEAPLCSSSEISQAEGIEAGFSVTEEEQMYKIVCSTEEEIGEKDLCYVLCQSGDNMQVYQPFYLEDNCFELRIPRGEKTFETEDFKLYIKRWENK